MRVYLSSTFEDLQEHRAAAIRALHRLGHEVVAMEYYGAGNAPPLEKVLADVETCDAYVGIFAWRYGFRPDDVPAGSPIPGTAAGETSITEYEYRRAVQIGLEILVFLVDERAPWPAHLVDAISRPEDAHHTLAFRNELQRERVVAYFTTPDSLATQLATAISTLGLRAEVKRGVLAALRSDRAVPVLAGQQLYDSHVAELKRFVLDSVQAQVVHVDLRGTWWSTRLYLLAALGESYGELRRLVFLDGKDLVGVASGSAVRREMLRFHDDAQVPNPLRDIEARLRSSDRVGNLDAQLDELIREWQALIGPGDELVPGRTTVRPPDLTRSLGDGLMRQSLKVKDINRLTVLDLLRILDFPTDVVPVEETRPRSRRGVMLIDKSALANTVARNSVQEMLDRLGLS